MSALTEPKLPTPCPACGQSLRIPATLRGRSVRCKKCGCQFDVPVEASDTTVPDGPGLPLDFLSDPGGAPDPPPSTTEVLELGDELPLGTRCRPLWVGGGVLCALLAGTIILVFAASDRTRPTASDPPSVATNQGARPSQEPLKKVPAQLPEGTDHPPPLTASLPVAPEPHAPAKPGPRPPARGKKNPQAVPGPSAPDPKAVAERVKQSVVLIEGKYGHGSGFLVLPDVVATNSHVILCEVMKNVTVRFATNGVTTDKGVRVQLLYEDKGRDLVLLRLERHEDRPALPLAKDFKPDGRPEVFVVGNPGQGESGQALANVVESGRCEEEVQLIGGKAYYRLTYATGPGDVRIGYGNSGGPAVDRRGEVIGVVTRADFRADGRPTGTAYCIPGSSIRTALDSLGSSDGWAKKIDAATARHAGDIVAIASYGNSLVAIGAIEQRYTLLQLRNNPRANGQKIKQLDNKLVKTFEDMDKNFKDMIVPARKAIIQAGGALTPGQTSNLQKFQTELVALRPLAKAVSISTHDYRWATQGSKERCDNLFDKFCKDGGMTDECVLRMVTEIWQEAGIDLK